MPLTTVAQRWHKIPGKQTPIAALACVLPDGLALRCTGPLQTWLIRRFQLPLTVERRQPTLYVPLPLVEAVLDTLPSELRTLVEDHRPHWIGWKVREEALRVQRSHREVRLADLSGTQTHADDLELLALAAAQDPGLDPFQHVGVSWLRLAQGLGIVGDDMGLGKTVQALCYLAMTPAVHRVLVVCPTSVAVNWSIEAKRWAPDLHLFTAPTQAQIRKKLTELSHSGDRGGLVVSWGMLRFVQDELLAAGFDTIVCDEAHNMKEVTSLRTQAMLALGHKANRRLALTGTPVKNRPRELWTLFHLIDPLRFPLFEPFGERYCGARYKWIGRREVRVYEGKSRQTELNALSRAYLIRREKTQVLTQLPAKRWQTIPLQPSPKFARVLRDTLAEIKQERESPDGGGKALGLLGKLRKSIGLEKLEAAVDQIETMLADEEPVVAFLYHTEVCQQLQAELDRRKIRYATIVGGVGMLKRQAIVEGFQRGDYDVLIGSEACKEGITLTRSRITLHLEYWWTPGDQAQAEDRVARRGQTRGTLHVYLHMLDSLDDYVKQILEDKQTTIDALMDRTSIQSELLAAILTQSAP